MGLWGCLTMSHKACLTISLTACLISMNLKACSLSRLILRHALYHERAGSEYLTSAVITTQGQVYILHTCKKRKNKKKKGSRASILKYTSTRHYCARHDRSVTLCAIAATALKKNIHTNTQTHRHTRLASFSSSTIFSQLPGAPP